MNKIIDILFCWCFAILYSVSYSISKWIFFFSFWAVLLFQPLYCDGLNSFFVLCTPVRLSLHHHVQCSFLKFLPKQLRYLSLTAFLCACFHVMFMCYNKHINNGFWSSLFFSPPCLFYISLSVWLIVCWSYVSKYPWDQKRSWINMMYS